MLQNFNSLNIAKYTGIFAWQDAAEIIFFSFAIYFFLRWLSQNQYKSLLVYFHSYCLLFFCSYFFGLTAINQTLIFFAPVIFTLLIIFHQKALQKNFVGTATKKSYTKLNTEWIETVMRSSLHIISKNKPIRCIIERKDPLDNLLESSFFFDANIDKNLFNIILENKIVEPKKLIWLTEDGKIKAINSSWHIQNQDEWFGKEYDFDQETKWFEQAQIFTEQNDAILFSITPENRSFNLILEGKHISDISAYNFLKFIKMYGFSQTKSEKRSNVYEVPNKKHISDEIAS